MENNNDLFDYEQFERLTEPIRKIYQAQENFSQITNTTKTMAESLTPVLEANKKMASMYSSLEMTENVSNMMNAYSQNIKNSVPDYSKMHDSINAMISTLESAQNILYKGDLTATLKSFSDVCSYEKEIEFPDDISFSDMRSAVNDENQEDQEECKEYEETGLTVEEVEKQIKGINIAMKLEEFIPQMMYFYYIVDCMVPASAKQLLYAKIIEYIVKCFNEGMVVAGVALFGWLIDRLLFDCKLYSKFIKLKNPKK